MRSLQKQLYLLERFAITLLKIIVKGLSLKFPLQRLINEMLT